MLHYEEDLSTPLGVAHMLFTALLGMIAIASTFAFATFLFIICLVPPEPEHSEPLVRQQPSADRLARRHQERLEWCIDCVESGRLDRMKADIEVLHGAYGHAMTLAREAGNEEVCQAEWAETMAHVRRMENQVEEIERDWIEAVFCRVEETD